MKHDLAIVGAGLVGLATAREFLMRWPRMRIIVLEKDDDVGKHQSARNSGVVHSGIYYTPGSLKAKLCTLGRRLLERYCEEKQIPYRRVGKLIIATRATESVQLDNLLVRGIANGVEGVRRVDEHEIRELEPNCVGNDGILCPSTAIVDFKSVAATLGRDVREFGGTVVTSARVDRISSRNGFEIIHTTKGDFTADYVMTAAGLHADRVAALSGYVAPIRFVPFRGQFYSFRHAKRNLVQRNIYPVPRPVGGVQFPFLGVHLTPKIDGALWAGPTAVPAFSREGYKRTDLSLRDMWNAWANIDFFKFARANIATGMREIVQDFFPAVLLQEIQRFAPSVTADDIVLAGSGVHTIAVARNGRTIEDFLTTSNGRTFHVVHAPSPGATASLAIGRHLATTLCDRFALI